MKPKTRLFAVLARQGRNAVIFRRGPSKRVLLIKWWREDDRFELGHWLQGRIYERRCDLSPSGEYLVYFAARFKEPLPTWTAICRPPYLTALALWPNGNGAWGGGGLFKDESTLLLNHDPNDMQLGNGFSLPPGFTVKPMGKHSGRGEDAEVLVARMERDGWVCTQQGVEPPVPQDDGRMFIHFDPPFIFERTAAQGGQVRRLRMLLLGFGESQGDWYVTDYEVIGEGGARLLHLPRINWADWDGNGDLLFAQDGKLYRRAWAGPQAERGTPRLLADFSEIPFEGDASPEVLRH